MIELPRRAAGTFLSLLRRLRPPGSPRGQPPPCLLACGPGGTSLYAAAGDALLRWHRPGRRPAASVVLPADALAAIGAAGGGDATVSADGARWEGGAAAFAAGDPPSVPPFPQPARWAAQPPGFLHALAEAGRTAAAEDTRFALSRVLLAGAAGRVAGSDGKALLVAGGFALPWRDDIMVPRCPALAAKGLQAGGEAGVGRAGGHVVVRAGPWSVALPAATGLRYPPYDDVVPKAAQGLATLALDAEDAARWAEAVAARPGAGDAERPATLAFDGAGGARLLAGEGAWLDAPRSRAAGAACRAAFDRRYLGRALALGLHALECRGPAKPLVARGGDTALVWMPLDDAQAVPAAASAATAAAAPTDPPPAPPRGAAMPEPDAVGPEPPASLEDAIAAAEAVQGLLRDAGQRLAALAAALRRQRRQSRAVRQAVRSLRQLGDYGG